MGFTKVLAAVLVLGVAGQAFAEEPEKIVGGREALVKEFPHQVSLRMGGQHFCGGSIISNTKILTAAHCVHGLAAPYNNIAVVSGTNALLYGGQTHAIQSIVSHEAYQHSQATSWVNDVAIITLTRPMVFNIAQRPIALASQPPQSGASAVVSGFGLTRVGGRVSEVLKTAQMQILSPQQCQQYHNNRIYPTQVCALHSRGTGVCSGDSGGPLVVNGYQAGIVSWVMPCAMGYPDVYTSVAHHIGWIQRHM